MIVFLVEFLMLSTSLLASSPVLETGAYFVEPIRFLMVIKLIVVRSLGFFDVDDIDDSLEVLFHSMARKNEINGNCFFRFNVDSSYLI